MVINNYPAFIKFEELFSPEIQSELQQRIWKTPVEKRDIVWSKKNIPYKEIERTFIDVVIQRNTFAQSKGYDSYLSFKIDQLKIPKSEVERFFNNIDLSINACNKILKNIKPKSSDFYSEFGNHCYICEIKDFPFKSEEDAVKSFGNDYSKISIKKDDMSFLSNNGSNSVIHINESLNIRHKTLDLIHEIIHAETKQPGQNKYVSERNVLVDELKFYKEHYPNVYIALFGELLKVFHRVLFEIELYNNPNQNLAKLYAKIFNRCFGGNFQKQNRTYLLDTLIVRYPFQNLPHALAQVNLLASDSYKHED